MKHAASFAFFLLLLPTRFVSAQTIAVETGISAVHTDDELSGGPISFEVGFTHRISNNFSYSIRGFSNYEENVKYGLNTIGDVNVEQDALLSRKQIGVDLTVDCIDFFTQSEDFMLNIGISGRMRSETIQTAMCMWFYTYIGPYPLDNQFDAGFVVEPVIKHYFTDQLGVSFSAGAHWYPNDIPVYTAKAGALFRFNL